MAKKDCPVCHGTGIGSVTKKYHPVTGKVTGRINHPCRSCT